MQGLMTRLLPNEYGMPEGYYRADLLPDATTDVLTQAAEQDEVAPAPSPSPDPSSSPSPSPEPTSGSRMRATNGGSSSSSSSSSGTLVPSSPGSPMEIYDAAVNGDPTHAQVVGEAIARLDPRMIQMAFVPLSYDNGFPTQSNGNAFWGRLEHEHPVAQGLFVQYLEMPFSAANGAMGVRDLGRLTAEASREDASFALTYKDIREMSRLYCWHQRAKAYDLFQVAQRRHVRAQRVLQADDDFYLMAVRLANVAEQYIMTPEFMEGLTPKTALDTLKTAQQLMRASLGQPPNGMAPNQQVAQQTNIHVTDVHTQMKQVAQEASAGDGRDDDSDDIFDDILEDPETAANAQALILKLSGKKRGDVIDSFRGKGTVIDVDPDTGNATTPETETEPGVGSGSRVRASEPKAAGE